MDSKTCETCVNYSAQPGNPRIGACVEDVEGRIGGGCFYLCVGADSRACEHHALSTDSFKEVAMDELCEFLVIARTAFMCGDSVLGEWMQSKHEAYERRLGALGVDFDG